MEKSFDFINKNYGKEYVPSKPHVYKTKAGAQDGHEAIRPTNVNLTPSMVEKSLTKDQYRLYKLIWERFVASQMSPALYDTLSVKLMAGDYSFRASGSRLRFAGFLEVYNKGEEEDEKVAMATDFIFEPLEELTEKEQVEIFKAKVEIGKELIETYNTSNEDILEWLKEDKRFNLDNIKVDYSTPGIEEYGEYEEGTTDYQEQEGGDLL